MSSDHKSQTGQQSGEDFNKPREVLAMIEASWNAAAQEWDPDRLASLYTQDALFFGGKPEHSTGVNAIREYFRFYKGTIESAKLVLTNQKILVFNKHLFLAQGYGEMSFLLSGNRPSQSTLRTTMVITYSDDWKIQQWHFSPPPAAPPLGND